MKKAYNLDWVRNRLIQRQARRWYRAGQLSAEQVAETKRLFPDGFYHAHWWVKVALFLFTLLLNGCASSLGGAFLVPILEAGTVAAGIASLAYAGGLFFLLTTLIRERKLYHSGIDNALLYAMVVAAVGGTCLLVVDVVDETTWVYGLLALPTLVWAAVRYNSRLLTLTAVLTLTATVALLAVTAPIGKLLLPFLMLGLAAGLYAGLHRQRRREDAFYWDDCLDVAETFALVLGYTAGNYFVVREGNAALAGLPESVPVAFAPLFYVLTAGVPLAYGYFGLKHHDRIRLRVGLLAAAASVATLQHYARPVSYEWFSVLAGAVLVAGAWALIRYLETPWRGLTSVPDEAVRSTEGAEALVTAQVGQVPTQPDPLFGGGNFGGGGAGTGY
jgi:hypothetical protein